MQNPCNRKEGREGPHLIDSFQSLTSQHSQHLGFVLFGKTLFSRPIEKDHFGLVGSKNRDNDYVRVYLDCSWSTAHSSCAHDQLIIRSCNHNSQQDRDVTTGEREREREKEKDLVVIPFSAFQHKLTELNRTH